MPTCSKSKNGTTEQAITPANSSEQARVARYMPSCMCKSQTVHGLPALDIDSRARCMAGCNITAYCDLRAPRRPMEGSLICCLQSIGSKRISVPQSFPQKNGLVSGNLMACQSVYSSASIPSETVDSNRVEFFRNASFTFPVGPFRCFAMINSARPWRSGSSGL
jgi:hypothetical protein